jgi:WD40 repeat protein
MSQVASGDDFGYLNIHNFPCVAKNAPSIRMSGHSSHVMSVKFLQTPPAQQRQSTTRRLVTVGGNDNSVMLWSLSKK